MSTVSLEGVSKRYRMFPRPWDRLVETLSLGRAERGREFWALKDVNLSVGPGSSLGILGRNGAGKSTLLKIISGVLQPTSGSVSVDGRLVALLQLGAGFKPEYTGRENAMLNGLILGIERKEMIRRFDEIEAFADIGEFMDQPVKTYSSGMRARLGFAVAVNVDPDVLLVDEALSVGDAVFRQVGTQKMRELRDSGTTVLFVSHGLEMIRDFCDKAVLLHRGRVLYHGNTNQALDHYRDLTSNAEENAGTQNSGSTKRPSNGSSAPGEDGPQAPSAEQNRALGLSERWGLRRGTGGARIENVEVLDERGRAVDEAAPDSPLKIRVHLRYTETIRASAARIILQNKSGLILFSTTTNREGKPIGKRRKGELVIVDFILRQVPIRHGTYSISAAVLDSAADNRYLDWVGVAAVFDVVRPTDRPSFTGLVQLPTEIEVHSPSRAKNPGPRA